MKILYVTTYFDNIESAAVRNNSLIRGLTAIGHVVDVLTVEHPKAKTSELFANCPCNKIIRTKIGITSFIENKRKQLRWINNSILGEAKDFIRETLFFPDVYSNWHKLVNINNYGNYDIIISSSDCKSSHFVALKIKNRFRNIKWIQIWGDPWSLDTMLNQWSRIRAKRKERMLIKAADKVIYVSLFTYKAIGHKYPCYFDKVKYVPRSYYSEIIKDTKPGNKSCYKILYPGALTPERSCISFLKNINNFNKNGGVRFEVIFYGNYLNTTMELLQSFDFVTVHNSVSFEKIQEVYYDIDSFLFISNKESSTQIPGKLFDFMGTNIPIICIVNPNNSELISFLNQFEKCLIYKENFLDIVNRIQTGEFTVEYQFSPENVADQVLKC